LKRRNGGIGWEGKEGRPFNTFLNKNEKSGRTNLARRLKTSGETTRQILPRV